MNNRCNLGACDTLELIRLDMTDWSLQTVSDNDVGSRTVSQDCNIRNRLTVCSDNVFTRITHKQTVPMPRLIRHSQLFAAIYGHKLNQTRSKVSAVLVARTTAEESPM